VDEMETDKDDFTFFLGILTIIIYFLSVAMLLLKLAGYGIRKIEERARQ
jgi:hypothetical protein